MKARHVIALELLLSYPDTMVAEMLGVRLRTLARWMQDELFSQTLREREREQRNGLARIARQAAIRAAATLCSAVQDQSKPDIKALLEVLKVSGAFEEIQSSPEEALAEVIKLATRAAEVADERESC